MKVMHQLPITLLVGTILGAVAMHALHAQAKPPAYAIVEPEVSDPEGYKVFVQRNVPLIAAAGGRFLVRGGKTTALSGEAPKFVAVIQWESAEKAEAYYNSAAFKEILPLAEKASKFRQFLIEGLAN
jgi:uncharacterized protein (DUF1330 family)